MDEKNVDAEDNAVSSEFNPLPPSEPESETVTVNSRYWRVCDSNLPQEGGRLHTCVEGRYVTLFRYRGKLSCIDSVCHHAGGPLTDGPIQDIEELGLTVVLCPWHKFMVSIDGGVKAFQGVDIINGVPVKSGWKKGKIVQRPHSVIEKEDGVYVSLVITDEPCVSDGDSTNERCGKMFRLHSYVPSL